jgi:hypothetical protein
VDVDRLRADEEAGWRALHQAFDRIPADRFAEPTLTREGWSPKDAMFHVGAWMADCAQQLERMRAGTFQPGEETRATIERRNAEWLELSKALEPEVVRAEFASAHVRMNEEFGSMPGVTGDAWEWFEESGPLHYREHTNDLRRFADTEDDTNPP